MNSMKLASGRKEMTPMDANINELVSSLNAVPEGASPEQAANVLFPNDKEAQSEYLKQAYALQRTYDKAQASAKPSPQVGARSTRQAVAALPAFVAAALPFIARCVISGLGSAGINEILTLLSKGKKATAESRVAAFVGGCIQSLIPFKPLANKLKKPIARAVLAIIKKLR